MRYGGLLGYLTEYKLDKVDIDIDLMVMCYSAQEFFRFLNAAMGEFEKRSNRGYYKT